LAVEVDGEKIDYGSLLKQFEVTDILEGNLNLAVGVTGKGISVRDIMAGLDGGVKVTSKGGRLKMGALSALSQGVSVSDLTGALTGGGKASGEDAQALRCIYMDMPIRKGIAKGEAMLLETGGFAMIGEGGANLRDETLALRFQPRAKKTSLATMIQPVTVAGTFANPTFGVEAEKALTGAAAGAAAAVATGGLSVIAGALIGAGSAQGADQTDYCALAFAGKPLKPAKSASSSGDGGQKEESGGAIESITKGVGGALKGLFGN
jgi:uncharacterized protein involved in outer membrane biogenesis